MLCKDQATALPLRLCAEEDARIYIGEVSLDDLVVVFTNLATGRTITMDAQMSGDEVYVNASDIPGVQGQVYEVSIRKTGAIALFSPYGLVGTAMVPVQDTYASVLVAFIGVTEVGGGYYTNADQWLTIP